MELVKLREKFKQSEIEWRVGMSGGSKDKPWCMVLAYVTNRAIQNRLDDVCGQGFWKNEYKEWHEKGQLCGISIYNPNLKEWITKWDGADNTNMEATKGGLSDSMKRAGYQWGIGRYLYELESCFAQVSIEKQKGWNYVKAKGSTPAFYWKAPDLPKWALPETQPAPKKETDPRIIKIAGFVKLKTEKKSVTVKDIQAYLEECGLNSELKPEHLDGIIDTLGIM